MKTNILFFAFVTALFPAMGNAATTCSKANLTRCLDSACAINISSNPAARCQYCGTASAGTPPTKKGMQSISVGTSSKNTLTEKELKSAPSDPGERYVWATSQCIAKLGGTCTTDDVADTYDKLIEQSCKAAGVTAQRDSARASLKKTVSSTSCKTDITACLIADKKCGADYSACEDDTVFNNYFSACSVEAVGCDQHLSSIREGLIAARNDAVKNADVLLAGIVKSYQDKRNAKLNAAKKGCENDNARDLCIETICQNNMKNKCAIGFESEKSAAVQLCKFYDTACNTLK